MAVERAHVIWDFNGTLLDDVAAAMAAVTDMLAARGGPAMTLGWYHSLVEMPIIRFYEKIPLLAGLSAEAVAEGFNAGYARHGDRIALAPGAREALETLRAAGVGQTILSSFEQSRIEGWLAHFGIGHYFEAVLGAGDLHSESKIERAVAWAAYRGIDGARTLLVGDTVHDWEAAQALGVRCALVAYGHQSREDLAACGVPVLSSLTDLPPLLARLGLLEEVSL